MKHFLLLVKDLLDKIFHTLNRRQRSLTFLVFFLTLVGALLEVIGVSAVLPLIQAMIYPDQLRENAFIQRITEALRIESDIQLLLLVALGVIGVYFFKNGYLIFLSYIRIKYSASIQRELGIRIMKIYMDQGYPFFIKRNI